MESSDDRRFRSARYLAMRDISVYLKQIKAKTISENGDVWDVGTHYLTINTPVWMNRQLGLWGINSRGNLNQSRKK